MTTRNFTKIMMVSAILCTASVFSEEASDAATTDKAKDAEKMIVAPTTPDAVAAELEASRRVIMEMKAPRDQHMAAAGELANQIEARRKTILEENKDAAKLSTDIAEMDKTLEEKTVALKAIFEADEKLAALQVKMEEERNNFGKNQLKLREEIARQHRERRLAMEAAQQKEAAAKAKTDEGAKTDEAAKENAGK